MRQPHLRRRSTKATRRRTAMVKVNRMLRRRSNLKSHRKPKRSRNRQTAGKLKWNLFNDVFGEDGKDTNIGHHHFLRDTESELRSRRRSSRQLTPMDIELNMNRDPYYRTKTNNVFDEPTDWWDTEKHGDKYTESVKRVERAARLGY